MAVSGNNVHYNGEDLFTNTFKFIVAVDVMDDESTVLIKSDDAAERSQNGGFASIRHRSCSTIANTTQFCMEIWVPLYLHKINAA